jgi:hypothetical protein
LNPRITKQEEFFKYPDSSKPGVLRDRLNAIAEFLNHRIVEFGIYAFHKDGRTVPSKQAAQLGEEIVRVFRGFAQVYNG